MANKASTAVRNACAEAVASELTGGFLDIYGGIVPPSPESSVGAATKLCRVSLNDSGTGLSFEDNASNGVIAKKISETWMGTNLATGTATFFRFVQDGDDGTEDADAVRLQGTVGVIGADLNISDVALVSGAPQTVKYFFVASP